MSQSEYIENPIIKIIADTKIGTIGSVTKVKTETGELFIKYWGASNIAPLEREQLLRGSGLPGTLLNTKTNMTIGIGELYTYKESYIQKNDKTVCVNAECPMPEEIKDFYDRSGGKRYFRRASNELHVHANVFTEFELSDGIAAGLDNKPKNRYAKMSLKQSKYIRLEQMDTNGVIRNAYWKGDGWQKRSDEKIAKFSPKKITLLQDEHVEGIVEPTENLLYHTGLDMFSDEYYFIPIHDAAAIEIAVLKQISKTQDAYLNQSLVGGSHVEILDELTDDGTKPFTDEESKKKQENARSKFDEIGSTVKEQLVGADKAGKLLLSTYKVMDNGKEVSDIKVKQIESKFNQEAYTVLMNAIRSNIIGVFQVHPTLANIESAGKLSSGSEMRNAYLSWIAIHASTYREILIEAMEIAKKLNQWDAEIKFGFRDAVITTLSEQQTGTKTTNING